MAAISMVVATILVAGCTTGQELDVGYTVTVVNQSSESATLWWLEDSGTPDSEPVGACSVLRRGFAIGHSYEVRLSSSRDAVAFRLSVTHVVPIPQRVLLVHEDGTIQSLALRARQPRHERCAQQRARDGSRSGQGQVRRRLDEPLVVDG